MNFVKSNQKMGSKLKKSRRVPKVWISTPAPTSRRSTPSSGTHIEPVRQADKPRVQHVGSNERFFVPSFLQIQICTKFKRFRSKLHYVESLHVGCMLTFSDVSAAHLQPNFLTCTLNKTIPPPGTPRGCSYLPQNSEEEDPPRRICTWCFEEGPLFRKWIYVTIDVLLTWLIVLSSASFYFSLL